MRNFIFEFEYVGARVLFPDIFVGKVRRFKTLSDKVLFLRDLIDVFVSGRCEIDLSRRKSHQSSEISRFNGSNSWR